LWHGLPAMLTCSDFSQALARGLRGITVLEVVRCGWRLLVLP
jgi:hypothetical protein